MTLAAVVLAWPLRAVPGPITREGARQAARRELSKPIYGHPVPWWYRPLRAVGRWLSHLLSGLAHIAPGGGGGLVVIVVLVAVVALAVALRAGPLRGARRRRADPLAAEREVDAAEHRRRAEGHAMAGEWADAVRERLRAIVRDLERREVIDARAGRTAYEIAAEAGRVLPLVARDLDRAAQAFNDVWYGGRRAGPETYELLCRTDELVAAARPAVGAPVGAR